MQCNLSTESFLRFPQHSAVYQNCPLREYKMILEIVAAQRKIQYKGNFFHSPKSNDIRTHKSPVIASSWPQANLASTLNG